MKNIFSLSKSYIKKISYSFTFIFSFSLLISNRPLTIANAKSGDTPDKTISNELTVAAAPSFTNLQSYLIYSSFYLSSEQYQELTYYFTKNNIPLNTTTPEISVEGKTIFLSNSTISAEIVTNGLQVNGYTWNLKKFANIESALDDLSRHLRSANKKTSDNKLFKQKISFALGDIAYANDNNSIDLSYRIGAGLLAVASVALLSPVAIPAALAYTLAAAGGAAVANGLVESAKLHFSQLQCRGEEIVLYLNKPGHNQKTNQKTLILRKDQIFVKTDQGFGQGYAGKFIDPKLTAELRKACSDERYKTTLLKNINSIQIPTKLISTPGSSKAVPVKSDQSNSNGSN